MVAFEPMSQGFLENPHDVFRHHREAGAAYRHQDAWPAPVVSIMRHAEVRTAFRDHETYSNYVPPEDRLLELADAMSMLGEDPPEHTRIRSAVNRYFTGRVMKGLEPNVRAIVEQVFDDALERGEVDVVEDLAARIAVNVISEIVGVPEEGRALVREWTKRQAVFNGASFWLTGEDDPNIARYSGITAEVIGEMKECFTGLYADHQRQPRDDLMTMIVDSDLNEDDGINLAMLLVLAGNDTTLNLMNNIASALLDHPDQMALVRSEPELVSATVEETLRFSPPVQWTPRVATRDHEIDGTPVRAGEGVVLWTGSANRDDRAYTNPDVFDIKRDTSSLLVSFGLGHHACIGSILARLEGRVFLETLLQRTASVERTSDVMPPLPTPAFCGTSQQLVRLTPS